MTTKQQQRTLIKKKLSKLTERQIEQMSSRMCSNFTKGKLYEQADVIMAYMALPGEADPREILEAALADGKTAVVPVVNSQAHCLEPIKIDSLTKGFKKSSYGIWEPERAETIQQSKIDVIVTPGLGFDLERNRLGRGGGFYDRFLSDEANRANACGFCFSCQIVEEVVTAENDQSVDALLTEKGLLQIR